MSTDEIERRPSEVGFDFIPDAKTAQSPVTSTWSPLRDGLYNKQALQRLTQMRLGGVPGD